MSPYPHTLNAPYLDSVTGVSELPLTTPVAYIVFNRPELTAKSFARIRDQRPTDLFLIADGPRTGHPTDFERCRRVREIVAQVDWHCTVHRNYTEVNLGCKERPSSGLDWVFSQVDRAIILEDDCIPNDDFFTFCDALLDKYQDDERVAVITGDNFQDGVRRGEGVYYFSKYNHGWGWATWRRAWRHYDRDIKFWPTWRMSAQWRVIHPDPLERRYWERVFDCVAAGKLDTWDYPWTASTWYWGGLTATPNVNLVSNIGASPDATHTRTSSDQLERSTEPLGALVHLSKVELDYEADRYTFDHHFGGAALRERRGLFGFLRWATRGGARRLRRLLSAAAAERNARRAGP